MPAFSARTAVYNYRLESVKQAFEEGSLGEGAKHRLRYRAVITGKMHHPRAKCTHGQNALPTGKMHYPQAKCTTPLNLRPLPGRSGNKMDGSHRQMSHPGANRLPVSRWPSLLSCQKCQGRNRPHRPHLRQNPTRLTTSRLSPSGRYLAMRTVGTIRPSAPTP
jgi:hypothetical protein